MIQKLIKGQSSIFDNEVKMKKLNIVCVTSVILMSLFSSQLLSKVKGQSTAVGCVIVEIIGSYPKEIGPLEKEFDVRILCQYMTKKNKLKDHFYTIKTNSDGYFKIDNVPEGKYLLKAVETNVGRVARITFGSKFGRWGMSARKRYWGIMNGTMLDNVKNLLSDEFEMEAQKDIIDLGITYFQLQINEGTAGVGLQNISPDGQPPWQRLSINDRGSTLDLFLIYSGNFPELNNQSPGDNEFKYSKISPVAYYKQELDNREMQSEE